MGDIADDLEAAHLAVWEAELALDRFHATFRNFQFRGERPETAMIEKPYHIFAEDIEEEALKQFESVMAHPSVVAGALMPDAHTGYTMPIGGVVACRNMVFPSFVGYDIGCGMCAVAVDVDPVDVEKNRDAIYDGILSDIPIGAFKHNNCDTEDKYSLASCPRTDAAWDIFNRNGLKQLGSLGGGNHFIEIGKGTSGKVWIIVHSGSRGVGHAVATHHMKLASGDGKAREGLYGFAADTREGLDYISDLNFMLWFAIANREEIAARIVRVLQRVLGGCNRIDFINRNHNHAELRGDVWIHRKGATHAELEMRGVVPGNMRDGTFIVEGLGNSDSLWSSSHGAGRQMSRKKAKFSIALDEFRRQMEGIKANVCEDTLEEAPDAYKDIWKVMAAQSGLVRVIEHVKPIINVKGAA